MNKNLIQIQNIIVVIIANTLILIIIINLLLQILKKNIFELLFLKFYQKE